MNHVNEHPGLSLRLFDPDPALVYSIDVVERLAQVPRRTILLCCRHGLVSPLADPEFGGYYFNRESIRALRRIGYLHVICGVNLAGIKFILDLTDEVQRLRTTSCSFTLNSIGQFQEDGILCQSSKSFQRRAARP